MYCKNNCFNTTVTRLEEKYPEMKKVKFPSAILFGDGSKLTHVYNIPIYYKKVKKDGNLTVKYFETGLTIKFCPMCGEQMIKEEN